MLSPSNNSNSVPNSAECNEIESAAPNRAEEVDNSRHTKDERSPAHLAILIRDELRAVKHAFSCSGSIKPDVLEAEVCELIKAKHPEWLNYPVPDFYRKLAENDPLISSLIADCTGGAQWSEDRCDGTSPKKWVTKKC